jgi:Fe2+ transport system protein FeoA
MSKSSDEAAKRASVVDEHDRTVVSNRRRKENSAALHQRLEALGITPTVRVGITRLTPEGQLHLIGAEHDRQSQDGPSLIPIHTLEGSLVARRARSWVANARKGRR